jgi:glutathione S-transferase
MNRLVTIPFSHYCEKARWALQHCRVPFEESAHLPGAHFVPARRAGGKTVPVLVRDGAPPLTDSTDIVTWASAQTAPERGLFGDGEAERARIVALEEELDESLGVASRVWAYGWAFDDLRLFCRAISPSLSPLQRRLAPVSLRLIAPLIKKRYAVRPSTLQRAMHTIEGAFVTVGDKLHDRKFLVGNRLSAADLTFASLAAPLLMPDEHPSLTSIAEALPETVRSFIERLRLTPAGKHGLAMYRWWRVPKN